LDCPLFKQRIRLIETKIVIHSDNDFATVAYLRVLDASLEDKAEVAPVEPAIPLLLEQEFATVQEELLSASSPSLPDLVLRPFELSIYNSSLANPSSMWLAVTDVQSDNPAEQSIEYEARECFRILQDRLHQHSLGYSHCANINLFISSMDLFGRINAIYSEFFGSNPPARACVAVDLPGPSRMKLDCLAYAENNPRDRHALHVQGLSYWAPANIGPYSQAVMVNEQVFLSGQIGMQPSNLALPSPPSLALETALACQHVSRVLGALQDHSAGTWKGHTQLALYWLQERQHLPSVRQAGMSTETASTPCLYVAVAALPKGALVEKQVLVHTGRFLVKDEDGELETQLLTPTAGEEDISGDNGSLIHLEYSHFDGSRLSTLICLRGVPDETMLATLHQRLSSLSTEPLSHGRLFYRPSIPLPLVNFSTFKFPITTIPSRLISTKQADDWDYALCTLSLP